MLVQTAPKDSGYYVGSIYQYTGTDRPSLDLASVDFSDTTKWQMVSQQDVVVLADSENDSINGGGNYQTIGLGAVGGTTGNRKTWTFDPKMALDLTLVGTGSNETKGAVGASVLVLRTSDHNSALDPGWRDALRRRPAGPGAELHPEYRPRDVRRAEREFRVQRRRPLQRGLGHDARPDRCRRSVTVGSAHVVYADPSTAITTPNPFTKAGPVPADSGASVLVKAEDNTYLVTMAGAVSLGQKVGIGASVAYNNVSRQTEAVIGNPSTVTIGPGAGSVHSGGSVQIDASNGGFIGDFAVAGAKDAAPDPAPNQQDPPRSRPRWRSRSGSRTTP